jgi:hypothetical protein
MFGCRTALVRIYLTAIGTVILLMAVAGGVVLLLA